MKYALLILQCSSAIVLAAAGGLSGGSTGGGGIAGVGGGSSSSGTVTNLTGTDGITVTAGDPIVIGQDGTLATVAGLTTVSNQAANTRAAVYSPTYGLFGLAIKGGDGFPPTTNEQQARAIFSSDGAQWAGGTGLPVLYGLNGTLRDPAMYQVGDSYILSHTTNAIVSGSFLPSSGFPIYQSSNLLHWTFKTNLTFTLPGETLVAASNFCWSPVFHVSGATNYLLASVSTNNATSFEIRYRFAHTNDMVNGWGTTFRLDNQTGVTNLIDLTPFTDDDGITYAWYKNETDNYIELGRFDAGITSTFRPVLTNNHALWGANCEGNWMIKLPNGNYRLFFSRYQGKTYGNNGDGETLLYTESTSPTNWPSSGGQPITTNVVIGFYAQSFKPLVLRTAKAVADAVAATMSGQTFKGRINIDSEMRTSITKYGYASAQASGVPFTNDYAGINLGHGNFGQGMFGMGDGSLHLYTRTYDPADTNQFIFSYAKTFLRANSNSITLLLPLNSTNVNVTGTVTTTGNIIGGNNIQAAAGGQIFFDTRSKIRSGADGDLQLGNNGNTDFDTLKFGGTTAAFPALKRNGAGLTLVGADEVASPTNSLTIPGTVTATNGLILPWMEVTTDTNWNGLPSVAVAASSKTILLGTNYEEGRYFKIYQIGASSGVIYCPTGGVWSLTTGYATNFNLLQQTPTHLIWRKTNWIVW